MLFPEAGHLILQYNSLLKKLVCWKMTHSALKAGNKTSGVKSWYLHSLKTDSTFQKIHNKVQQITFPQNLPIIDWIPAEKRDN